jgi:hypothetical protein
MLKIFCGEGTLPLLFITDNAGRAARAGRPRHEMQGQDGLATYKPEGIRVCLGMDYA